MPDLELQVGDTIRFSRPEYGVEYTGQLLSKAGTSWRVSGQLGTCPEKYMTLVKSGTA